MMKRIILVFVTLLILIPMLSQAEQGIASKELFPSKGENGKWGYINCDGIFIIPPQYDYAFGFRGNYAEVVVFPEDYTGDRNPYYSGYSGLIDRDGHCVLEPVYSIDAGYDNMFFGGLNTGIWCIISGKNDKTNRLEGWFDIQSGYFSGLVWNSVWPWVSESILIPVIDDTFRAGYANRTTGELVIPCLYEPVDPSPFYGGVASVCRVDEEYDDTGNRECSDYFLIDETGTEIPLPKGIFAIRYEGAHDGLVMVSNHEDAIMYAYDEQNLFGFVDVHGNLVIEPQFIAAQHFSNGMAAVQFPEGDWGYINTNGIVTKRDLTKEPDWEYEDELP